MRPGAYGAAAPQTRAASLARALMLVAVSGLLLLQLVSLAAPLVGEHDWRQADSYAVARNLASHDASLLYPRIEWLREGNGVMGMEPPVLGAVVAGGLMLFGDHVPIARITAWLFFAAGAFVFARALARAFGKDAAIGALFALATSPLVLFETRQVQPDGPMLGMLLFAAGAFLDHHDQPRRARVVLGHLAFFLAVLLKPPALVAAPALYALLATRRGLTWRRRVLLALPFLAPLGAHLAWSAWSDHLNATFNQGDAYFATRVDWVDVWRGLSNPARWRKLWEVLLPTYTLGWALLPFFALGVLRAWQGRRELAASFVAWLVLGVAFLLLFVERVAFHWYYAAVVAPPIVFFAALGVARVLVHLRDFATAPAPERFALLAFGASAAVGGAWTGDGGKLLGQGDHLGVGWVSYIGLGSALALVLVAIGLARAAHVLGRLFSWLALGLVAAGCARATHDTTRSFLHRARFHQWRSYARDWGGLAAEVARRAAAREPILATGCTPAFLHRAKRPGFTDGPETVEKRGLDFYRARGVRLALYVHGYDRKPRVLEAQKAIAKHGRWELFCIAREGCPEREP